MTPPRLQHAEDLNYSDLTITTVLVIKRYFG